MKAMELQGMQMARISSASEEKHFGNLLKKPGQVLLTPGQYQIARRKDCCFTEGNQ